MQISNNCSFFNTVKYNKAKSGQSNVNQVLKTEAQDSFVSYNPAFKGKINIFKKMFLSFFPEKAVEPVKEFKSEVKKIVRKPVKKVKSLNPNLDVRMERVGIKPENIEAIKKTSNRHISHYLNMLKMCKDGFDENCVSEIFASTVTGTGKSHNNLLRVAYALKDKEIPQKYIAKVITNFKIKTNKFDFERFQKFKSIKLLSASPDGVPKRAFVGMTKKQIDEFFYVNVENIEMLKELIGPKDLVQLYDLDKEYIDMILEKTPVLVKKTKLHRALYNLILEKMKPMSYSTQPNFGLIEEKGYNPQSKIEFHDRISVLLKLLELAEQKTGGRTCWEAKEMTKILNKLPS